MGFLTTCAPCGGTQLLNKISEVNCAQKSYGIARLIFEGVGALPITTANVALIATWQVFLAALATDPEKRAITPVERMFAKTVTPAGVLESTENLYGAAETIGVQGVTILENSLKNLTDLQVAELREVSCWATAFWIVDTEGNIHGKKSGVASATGFPMFDTLLVLSEEDGEGDTRVKTKINKIRVKFRDADYENTRVIVPTTFARYQLIQI
jgi:hypothetical protein